MQNNLCFLLMDKKTEVQTREQKNHIESIFIQTFELFTLFPSLG